MVYGAHNQTPVLPRYHPSKVWTDLKNISGIVLQRTVFWEGGGEMMARKT